MPGVPTGCALFWVFAMETVRAGWIWWILRETNDGNQVAQWVREFSNYSFVAAATVLAATILRCTYLWSPPKWQRGFWIYSAASTIIFLFISHYSPQTGN